MSKNRKFSKANSYIKNLLDMLMKFIDVGFADFLKLPVLQKKFQ